MCAARQSPCGPWPSTPMPFPPWPRLTEVSLRANMPAARLVRQVKKVGKRLPRNRNHAGSQRHSPYPRILNQPQKRHHPLQYPAWRLIRKGVHSQLQFFLVQSLPTMKGMSVFPGKMRISPRTFPGRQRRTCHLSFTIAAPAPSPLTAALCSVPTCSCTSPPRSPWCASTATKSSAP